MVATKLYEVTAKGTEWAYGRQDSSSSSKLLGGSSSTRSSPVRQNSSSSAASSPAIRPAASPKILTTSPAIQTSLNASDSGDSADSSSYWNYANESMESVAHTALSNVASLLSSLYTDASFFDHANSLGTTPKLPIHSKLTDGAASRIRKPLLFSSKDLAMMLVENPYNLVRGRNDGDTGASSSLAAVKSLITLVPMEEDATPRRRTSSSASLLRRNSSTEMGEDPLDESLQEASKPLLSSSSIPKPSVSTPETASQIAEGTVRALRDLFLDEAIELHQALRFWTERWERPVLSCIEAGPEVWMSPGGYNHQSVGRKVAQIQAVLARRCAAIGELQQHLLRAGWQRGVAQWGVLGHGGQWAPIAGFDGRVAASQREQQSMMMRELVKDAGESRVEDEENNENETERAASFNLPPPAAAAAADAAVPAVAPILPPNMRSSSAPPRGLDRFMSCHLPDLTDESVAASIPKPNRKEIVFDIQTAPRTSSGSLHSNTSSGSLRRSRIGAAATPEIRNGTPKSTPASAAKTTSNIFVSTHDDGGLFVEDPALLAEWSVEAIALVRRQLTRAANGLTTLPYEAHWRRQTLDEQDSSGQLIVDAAVDDEEGRLLPVWAHEVQLPSSAAAGLGSIDETGSGGGVRNTSVVISDLPLFAEEVLGLLTSIEEIVAIQRARRLDKLRQPGWFRRNWYMLATVTPPISYVLYNILRKGAARDMIRYVYERIADFVQERVRGPIVAVVKELWSGSESFSDQKARMEAIESLKKMIKSWLDDTFPEMPELKRLELSEAMDVTLLEQEKEKAMRTFFEINNVIRMSFIEMQYMKKELLNALSAIDQMVTANDVNMNLAATTPVFILSYVCVRCVRFVYYALLKLGKSREEVYASFRNILTDIERLLVMRDNPPQQLAPAPPAMPGGSPQRLRSRSAGSEIMALTSTGSAGPRVLGSDDLGMLMLLIHECRSILWRNRRRFSLEMCRGVSEDLAEIAGERGAVSIQQQLQIISRMARTYPFLKVTSVGYFQHSRLRTSEW